MKTNEYIAIAVGLAAGYFLISWMSKRAAPAARSAGQDATAPNWARPNTTLGDIWSGNWATVTDNSGSVWTTN